MADGVEESEQSLNGTIPKTRSRTRTDESVDSQGQASGSSQMEVPLDDTLAKTRRGRKKKVVEAPVNIFITEPSPEHAEVVTRRQPTRSASPVE